MRIKPAFKYPGGKSRLLKYILPNIPPHKVYVEPFAGGGSVLLAKESCPKEVLNDINNNITSFYRYVKFHKEALLMELEMMPLSRTNFYDLRDAKPLTELQKVVWWYWVMLLSFGGQGRHYGRCAEGNRVAGYNREYHGKLINDLFERIKDVVIECIDYKHVCTFYDADETFFYLDPPYYNCSSTAYDSFNINQLSELANFIKTLKGKWLMSINDTPEVREIFSFAKFKEISIAYSISKSDNSKRKKYPELLVSNCFNQELI